MTRAGIAAVALLTAAGCTAGYGGMRARNVRDVAALLDERGVACTGLVIDSQPVEAFSREEATCTIGAEGVYIVTFADADAEARWTEVEQPRGPYVAGDGWVVAPESAATARRIQRALGGSLRP